MLSAGVVAPHELAFQPFHALLIVRADADFQQAFRFGTPDGEQAVGVASLQRFGAVEVVTVFGRFLFFAFHYFGGQYALAGKCVAHAVSGTFVFANMLGYDVTNLKSELGVIYLSSKNTEVLSKMLKRNELEFTELFTATPHVFICDSHPLASKKSITMDDLQDYPYLTYEQGEYNSQYFSEEFVSTLDSRKNIRVRDRATLFNLIIGLNGYTVCSGVISAELNGRNIISKPLDVEEYMRIGIISRKGVVLSRYAREYIEALKAHCM